MAALSLKVNLFSHSSTLCFKYGNLSSPLLWLKSEIDMGADWVFCRKWNSQQLLLQAFLIAKTFVLSTSRNLTATSKHLYTPPTFLHNSPNILSFPIIFPKIFNFSSSLKFLYIFSYIFVQFLQIFRKVTRNSDRKTSQIASKSFLLQNFSPSL